MRIKRIGVSLSLLMFVCGAQICRADVVTPEFEAMERRLDSLEQAALDARKHGTFEKQLAAANALDKMSSRSYHPYGSQSYKAKMMLADIYWANGQAGQAKQMLVQWNAEFEKTYAAGMQKIAVTDAKRKKQQENGGSYMVEDGDDPFFSMTFYKGGPGAVNGSARFGMQIYLSDLCIALGQTPEASQYLKRAKQIYDAEKAKSYSTINDKSWAAAVDSARLYEHPLFTALDREDEGSTDVQRLEHLKKMLNEAYKYGKENVCVAKTLCDMGRLYKGAQVSQGEPLLKRAVEIYWKNGSPEASNAASYYMACMISQKREQEGKKFIDGLKAANAQPKKQANAAASSNIAQKE